MRTLQITTVPGVPGKYPSLLIWGHRLGMSTRMAMRTGDDVTFEDVKLIETKNRHKMRDGSLVDIAVGEDSIYYLFDDNSAIRANLLGVDYPASAYEKVDVTV